MGLPYGWTETKYRKLLREYLNGGGGWAIEAAQYARSVGEVDYMYEIANEQMGRRVGRYRRTTEVPKAVWAQALRIGVESIQVPEAELLLDGQLVYCRAPISRQELLTRLQIPYTSSIYHWLPSPKDKAEAEAIMDASIERANGGLPVVGRSPRWAQKDAVKYGRGGLPPQFFYEEDEHGNAFFKMDGEWEKRFVLTFDALVGVPPIQLLWEGFWSRDCLIREGEDLNMTTQMIKPDDWAEKLLAAVE